MFSKSKKKIKIKRKKPSYQEWIEAILFAFVVAMIIRNYTFQNFKIPSSSMEKTLLIGDYLVANKVKYFFSDPKRGEIVTFRHPAQPEHPGEAFYANPIDRSKDFIKIFPPLYWDKKDFFFFGAEKITFFHIAYYARNNIVKRVVGIPGDTLEIVNKQLFINGKKADEPYVRHIDQRTIPRFTFNEYFRIYWDGEFMGSRDNFGPIVVPAESFFVMGDNRENSEDSRYWGFLPREYVTGTPFAVFFSRGSGKMRWDRIFTIIR